MINIAKEHAPSSVKRSDDTSRVRRALGEIASLCASLQVEMVELKAPLSIAETVASIDGAHRRRCMYLQAEDAQPYPEFTLDEVTVDVAGIKIVVRRSRDEITADERLACSTAPKKIHAGYNFVTVSFDDEAAYQKALAQARRQLDAAAPVAAEGDAR